jgi:hypothetical protein
MNIKILKVGCITISILAGRSFGFEQLGDLEKPAINLTEKWSSGASGWVTNSALCGWTNGALAVKFVPNMLGGIPLSLIGAEGASGSIFHGDFSKVEAVSFDVQPFNMTLLPCFYFISTSGREWKTSFQPSADGQKTTVSVPFSYSSNWTAGFKSTTAANFNTDKTSIVEVGFYLGQLPDQPLQSFSVDNLKLVGPWTGPFSNGVPLAWVMENGLTNNFANAGSADSDNDKFDNTAEFLAGTDPNNSNSFFRIEIVRNSKGKMVVRWTGNRDVNYEVRQANSLGPDSSFVTKTNFSPATVKTEEVLVDEADGNAKFFKVIINTNSL